MEGNLSTWCTQAFQIRYLDIFNYSYSQVEYAIQLDLVVNNYSNPNGCALLMYFVELLFFF